MKFQYLYGINPIIAAIKAQRRISQKLMVCEPIEEKAQIISLARQSGIPIEAVAKFKLEKFAPNKPHQGLVLKTSEITPHKINQVQSLNVDSFPFWLCLDEISDPQNLGAILRVAQFFNISGVLLSAYGSAPLSPAVAKVSSGAVETLNICSVDDMPKFLKKAKESSWRVLGTGKGVDLNSVLPKPKTILVLGNEGKGLRERVKKECQEIVWIKGGTETVDSLNVATATSVFVNALKIS